MSHSTANKPTFDMASQPSSSIDATADMPPDASTDAAPQAPPCPDATVDLPQKATQATAVTGGDHPASAGRTQLPRSGAADGAQSG
jgi:hypothetical protein